MKLPIPPPPPVLRPLPPPPAPKPNAGVEKISDHVAFAPIGSMLRMDVSSADGSRSCAMLTMQQAQDLYQRLGLSIVQMGKHSARWSND